MKEYPNYVDINLTGKLRHLHDCVKQIYPRKEQIHNKDLYQYFFKDKIHLSFPNVETILLRLFLCLMVTYCSEEGPFSQLKRIKRLTKSNHVTRKFVCT